MHTIPLFDLHRQHSTLKSKILATIEKVYNTNSFTFGPETEEFENSFAKLCNTKYAIGTHSGTDALILALKALDIKKDSEIITTPCTFSASADCIIHAGAKPIFIDVDSKTGNIDPDKIEKAISKKTQAILLVHLYGVPCEMDKIIKIAKKHQLKVIEDASHAHGSIYKNKPVGSLGDIACFSLYPSKSLGAIGNAGIITTNSKSLEKKVRMYANHGVKDFSKKYTHYVNGYNKLIDNIQSAALIHKLPLLKKTIKIKLQTAQKYNKALKLIGVNEMYWPKGTKPSLYVYAFQTNNRNIIQKHFANNKISTGVYYPTPLHLQPSMNFLGYKKGDLPNAEQFFKQTISLPIFAELTEQEINKIVITIQKMHTK
jgi:dTDP-4-amino-4,6-dideoxygalactose transaminase